MGQAKNIIVKPIGSADARRIVRKFHYSGKVVNNSQIHLGVFLNDKCGGAMQFGPSMDKRKLKGLVDGTLWNEFIEPNRMAFADWLPRNSESRAIGFAMRWLRKSYPWLKWVISFADATQCGDGTIYRASGFILTGIKENNQIWTSPDGKIASRITLSKGQHILGDGAASMKRFANCGWVAKSGFQLRYIYFLDPSARGILTVPEVPFSEIDRLGAGMYKGKQRAPKV